MRILKLYPFFLITLLTLVAAAASFQTTLWFQVFGTIPGPAIWLLILTYFAIYRSPKEAIVLSYLSSYVLYFFGWMPLGMWFFNVLVLWALIWVVKERIFWSGVGYFLIATSVVSVLWHIIYLISSLMIEMVPIRSGEFLNRIIQILLTPLFAAPVYYLIRWFEKLFDQPPVPQAGEANL